MEKKLLNNKILEAIDRGIQLALDNFEDIEGNNSISSDVINTNDIIGDKIKYEKLLQEFIDQIGDSIVLFFGKQKLNELILLSNKLNKKFVVKDNEFLQDIIDTICVRLDCPKANLNWIDVSKLEDFSNLFNNSTFNGDISEWDTSNAKTMYSCFAFSEFNGNLSKWNFSHVKNMDWMFQDSLFNNDSIKTWDVSHVKSMNGMFKDSNFNQDISNWNVENCKYFNLFNNNCKLEKQNMPKFS